MTPYGRSPLTQSPGCWLHLYLSSRGRLPLQEAAVSSQQPPEEALSGHHIEGASRLVVVDGVLDQALSDTAGLPDGVYCGGLQDAPAEIVDRCLVSTGLSGSHSPALDATAAVQVMHAAAVHARGAHAR